MIESKESLLEHWDYKLGDTVQSVWGEVGRVAI